jgi:hypothetical protein
MQNAENFVAAIFFQDSIFCILQSAARVARWYIFKPKIPIWVYFWRALEWKILIYFKDIWNILRPFGIFYGHLVTLVYFYLFWCIILEKSGNPDCDKPLMLTPTPAN